MKKRLTQSSKSQAIYDAMPPDMRTRLDQYIKLLQEKAKSNPAIAKMLAPPPTSAPDFSDIPIDVNLSLDEIVEQLRSIEHLPHPKYLRDQ